MVITLPYSDSYFLSAYPRECTETFHARHTSGFEFFGEACAHQLQQHHRQAHRWVPAVERS